MADADDDFPAAHSMDSTWFAVDADGFVGEFDTGEGGALPNQAAAGGEAVNFDAESLREWVIARRLVAGDLPPPAERVGPPVHPLRVMVAMMPSAEEAGSYREAAPLRYPAEALLAGGRPVVLREADPRLVVTREPLPPPVLAQLLGHPGVRRLLLEDDLFDLDEASGHHGLYRYANMDYVPGHYERQQRPEHAARIEELPPELREKVGQLRLPVRFAELGDLQLADHLTDDDVSTWGEVSLRGEPSAPAAGAARTAAKGGRSLVLVFVAVAAAALLALWLLK